MKGQLAKSNQLGNHPLQMASPWLATTHALLKGRLCKVCEYIPAENFTLCVCVCDVHVGEILHQQE